ncbi:hypothetical protein FGHELIBC_00007 [Camelpox virus]|uniref:Uncharacterized protein n=1 Tax=Camelpox virus TaxID=28873 RepID=A0A4Y5MY46_9POXV|nr:hypothetical protein FGHELIBC_00007 [Camelpox virus]
MDWKPRLLVNNIQDIFFFTLIHVNQGRDKTLSFLIHDPIKNGN